MEENTHLLAHLQFDIGNALQLFVFSCTSSGSRGRFASTLFTLHAGHYGLTSQAHRGAFIVRVTSGAHFTFGMMFTVVIDISATLAGPLRLIRFGIRVGVQYIKIVICVRRCCVNV